MRKRALFFLLFVMMLATACIQEVLPTCMSVPEGAPVSLTIGFGAMAPVEMKVGTKAEATEADESRVHDLYVLIFDSNGTRKYGRYFNYEHKWPNMDELKKQSDESEGWYVRNKTLVGAVDPITGTSVAKTVGAVKIATTALSSCTLVLLANVSNTLISLGGTDPVGALNAVATLSELRDLPVRLEQNIVERNDLFLMAGEYAGLDMTNMTWNDNDDQLDPSSTEIGSNFRVTLLPLDAKVKFRIKGGSDIRNLVPHKWSVSRIPSSCYLFPTNPYSEPQRTSYEFPDDGDKHFYFDTAPTYFDTEEGDWKTFTFYMLESCLVPEPGKSIDDPTAKASYYLREKQVKSGPDKGYVTNGEWEHAPANAPYVTFSLSMDLENDAIAVLDNWNIDNPQPYGATGEMTYTVHLGDFAHTSPTNPQSIVWNANDYNTKRGYFYTYDIIINNAASLYGEVTSFKLGANNGNEVQPGQEGSLLVYSDGMVNCDAHYEYQMIEFTYNSRVAEQIAALASDPTIQPIFSWKVKTPFSQDGKPTWKNGRYEADSTKIDFLWVKFAINDLENGTDPKASTYSKKRIPYPGKDAYDYTWYPGKAGAVPKLLDINQLINYIYYQYGLPEAENLFDASTPLSTIRVTAFVDEYYYQWHPFDGAVNPDLWRQFVNAEPREMHILSNVRSSQDQKSNLIDASHSIIQQSIQTIYNVDSPELSSIWGTEHKDEIWEKDGWSGWPWGGSGTFDTPTKAQTLDNGRLNSAALWAAYPDPGASHRLKWMQFLKYDVINSVPELRKGDEDDAEYVAAGFTRENYQKMVYSCMTRNRDNNGNGEIDPEEVRWYMASINQLKGMWIGNESLSTSARVYQPPAGDWRAHIISSSCPSSTTTPKILNTEEGVATFDYGATWHGDSADIERRRESVRCVRNVGTYSHLGATSDISNAPYDVIPDPFYTLEETVDPDHPTDAQYTSYTIQFRRLDPRSLREFTDKELPFHNEKSSNNRVYLKLHVQSQASRQLTPKYADYTGRGKESDASYHFVGENAKVDMGKINETITNDGYNKYCPSGYRLPNQAELAVMSLALPSSYWNSANVIRVPSRTFFSHGKYGSKDPVSEAVKLGFAYNPAGTNIFNPSDGQETSGIRCVRDDDLTGTISGSMYLSNTRLLKGDKTQLNFNFSSTAAAFKSGVLYLCYNDTGGHLVETEVPLVKQPEGLEYRTSQEFILPNPEDLDPSAGNPPFDMHFRLALTNVKDNSETSFYAYFTVVSVDIDCDINIQAGSDPDLGFPIRVHASAINSATINSLQLLYKKEGEPNWAPLHAVPNAEGKTDYEEVVYFKPDPLEETTYLFKALATSSTARSNTSAPKSMQFVKVNFQINKAADLGLHEWTSPWWNTVEDGQSVSNAYLWHQALVGNAPGYVNREQRYVINQTWKEKIVDLHFDKGDFIEVDMDLSNCVFIRTVAGNVGSTPYKNQIIGLDNIFSFGKKRIDWAGTNADKTDQIHFYYPAHVGDNNDQFQVDPVYNGNYGNPRIGQIPNDANDKRPLVLRLDNDGITYSTATNPSISINNVNDTKFKSYYPSVMANLKASHSLYIGAEEGNHLSRAIYNYVRVVRNDLGSATDNANGGFGNDPQNGGILY